MKRVAILGATGYIGKSLSNEFLLENKSQLFLFSRSKEKLREAFKSDAITNAHGYTFCELSEFNNHVYDVIINCAGVSDVTRIQNDPESFLRAADDIDTMIVHYLEKNNKVLYINMSSGAAGAENVVGLPRSTMQELVSIESLSPQQYYGAAKRIIEERHRSRPLLSIVDVRVFSFFSRFVDTESHFLLSEIVRCLQKKEVFETNNEDIMRDYISPRDLFSFISLLIDKKFVNDCFDIGSRAPVSKFELLDFLHKEYGLTFSIKESSAAKKGLSSNAYYGDIAKAQTLGYNPEFTSLSGIQHEINQMSM